MRLVVDLSMLTALAIAGCGDQSGQGETRESAPATGSDPATAIGSVSATAPDSLTRIRAISDAACSCTDKACGDQVYTRLYRFVADHRRAKIPTSQKASLESSTRKAATCLVEKGKLNPLLFAGLLQVAARSYATDTLAEMEGITGQACKCKDADCGTTALWIFSSYLRASKRHPVHKESLPRAKAATKKLVECLARTGIEPAITGRAIQQSAR